MHVNLTFKKFACLVLRKFSSRSQRALLISYNKVYWPVEGIFLPSEAEPQECVPQGSWKFFWV